MEMADWNQSQYLSQLPILPKLHNNNSLEPHRQNHHHINNRDFASPGENSRNSNDLSLTHSRMNELSTPKAGGGSTEFVCIITQ